MLDLARCILLHQVDRLRIGGDIDRRRKGALMPWRASPGSD